MLPNSIPAEERLPGLTRVRSRKRLLLAGFLLFLILITGGPYAYFSLRAEQELKAAVAETDLLDPGWRLLELEAKRMVVPDNENSAINLINAKTLMPAQWPVWEHPFAAANEGQKPEDVLAFDETFVKLKPERQLNERQALILQKEMTRASGALEEAYKITDKSHGRFPISYPKNFISYSLDSGSRRAADLLGFDVLLRLHNQDTDGAMRACRCIVQAQRAIGDEPLLTSMLDRMGIRYRVFQRLERILAQGQPSQISLAAMQRLLEQEVDEPLLLIGMRGERGISDGYLAALQSGDASLQDLRRAFDQQKKSTDTVEDFEIRVFPGMAKRNRAALLRYNNEIVEFAKLPLEEQRIRLPNSQPHPNELPWLAYFLASAWQKIGQANLRSVAGMRCCIVMLASERYRRDHQRWPERLDELLPAYLDRAPIDPFSGAPLRFRRTPDGLMIYSVGADRHDDGGNLSSSGTTPGTVVGVRLWNAAKRRQPAN